MAKAITLDDSVFQAPPKPPRASPSAAVPAPANDAPAPKARPAAKVVHVPLQIRISAADAKAIKLAAVQADQTISEFMLACFHASMRK
jgi:hypothetical protein